ncbi:putative dna helicase recq5 [Fasciola hepatica]|uniref:Dna helicase recq5 n=1 Tax=Fasciola hepatica TaxID=6192 RepID=A0A4E0RBA6_FASHE|nr:putative dna helicase recq5 [Fasciola hepatica]
MVENLKTTTCSTRRPQVSQPYNKTERTAAQHTRPFNFSEISGWWHRCFSPECAARALDARVFTSTTVLPSVVMLLPSCRHRLLADYFMDSPPNCNGQCDVCVDKTKVATNLSAFRAIALQTRIGRIQNAEGYEEDDEAISEDQLEEEDRLLRKKLIEEEFRKRRGNMEQVSLKSSWCAAPDNTHLLHPDSRTVTGITGKTRDQTLQLFFDALKIRFPDQETELWTKCAAVEYKLYKESKVAAMYRTRMARIITKIRRTDVSPEEVWSVLQAHLPADSQSVAQLASSINVSTFPKKEDCVDPQPHKEQVPHSDLVESSGLALPSVRVSAPSAFGKKEPSGPECLSKNGERSIETTDGSTYEDRKILAKSLGSYLYKPEDSVDSMQCASVVQKKWRSSTSCALKRSYTGNIVNSQDEELATKRIYNTELTQDQNNVTSSGVHSSTAQSVEKHIVYFWERHSNETTNGPPESVKTEPVIKCERPPSTERKVNPHAITAIPSALEDQKFRETKHIDQNEKNRRATDIAKLVVPSLSRYFTKNNFASKDVFKTVAKELTRRLLTHSISDPQVQIALIVKRLVHSAKTKPIQSDQDLDWKCII